MKRLANLLLPLLLAAEQKVELGYFGTTGNANTTSLSAGYFLESNLSASAKLSFKGDVLYASKDGAQSSERYRAMLSYEYTLRPSLFLFTQIAFLRNTFEGYNQQYNASFGVGKSLTLAATHHLDLLGGYQFRRNNYTTQPSQSFNYAKLQLKYRYDLGTKNSFNSNIDTIANIEDGSDYEVQITNDLILWIVDRLNFKLSFEVKYDNLPPAGKEKTDTITKAAIVYSF